MQELIDILQEEAEIMTPENRAEEVTRETLYSAARKISKDGPTTVLTPTEKASVRYALQDLGELYLLVGTSSGFDVETLEDEKEHQSRGRKAREQAAALGIYL